MTRHPLAAVSFRDPGGFVYEDEGCILRQVNFSARGHYDQLMRSGLYRELTERRLLIAHDEVDALPAGLRHRIQGDPTRAGQLDLLPF